MNPQRDFVFEHGGRRTNKSRVRVRIWDRNGKPVVLLSELPDNPGLSVTNAAEDIASALSKDLALAPLQTTWIEHYPQEGKLFHGRHAGGFPESFDTITFSWLKDFHAHDPNWRRISQADLEQLIGESWSVETVEQELTE